MKETILAVHPDHLDGALDLIKQLPGVAEAAVFGDGLHVAVTRARGDGAGHRRDPEGASHRPVAPHRAGPPSLEDAFIAVVQRAGRAVSKQQSEVS